MIFIVCVSSYRVELIDNGPIVKGANITFKASVYYGDKLAEGTFVYSWKDMALPTHTREVSHFTVISSKYLILL